MRMCGGANPVDAGVLDRDDTQITHVQCLLF